MAERLNEQVEFLESLDRMERIDVLIGIADRFREVPESVATRPFPEERKVPACESEAYAWAVSRDDGTFDFHFAVENPQGISAKAMAVLLGEGLSGAPLEDVATLDGDVVYRVFGRELSMGKSMGLMGMVTLVKQLASHQAKAQGAGAGP